MERTERKERQNDWKEKIAGREIKEEIMMEREKTEKEMNTIYCKIPPAEKRTSEGFETLDEELS